MSTKTENKNKESADSAADAFSKVADLIETATNGLYKALVNQDKIPETVIDSAVSFISIAASLLNSIAISQHRIAEATEAMATMAQRDLDAEVKAEVDARLKEQIEIIKSETKERSFIGKKKNTI